MRNSLNFIRACPLKRTSPHSEDKTQWSYVCAMGVVIDFTQPSLIIARLKLAARYQKSIQLQDVRFEYIGDVSSAGYIFCI